MIFFGETKNRADSDQNILVDILSHTRTYVRMYVSPTKSLVDTFKNIYFTGGLAAAADKDIIWSSASEGGAERKGRTIGPSAIPVYSSSSVTEERLVRPVALLIVKNS